jgi:hypothetical protein
MAYFSESIQNQKAGPVTGEQGRILGATIKKKTKILQRIGPVGCWPGRQKPPGPGA